MVETASSYDFSVIIDDFLLRKKLSGPHRNTITTTTRARALSLLSHPDVQYMPAFKMLEMVAALVNMAGAIDQATQLRPSEVNALLRESLSDTTPLLRHFMLEAALERARYAPLFIGDERREAMVARELVLQRRWAAMRATHQENASLPDDWMECVDTAVEAVLNADAFCSFRQGPLLQMFAEMLSIARTFHQSGESLNKLASALSSTGTLWRRYSLKYARFGQPKPKPADMKAIQPASHTIH